MGFVVGDPDWKLDGKRDGRGTAGLRSQASH